MRGKERFSAPENASHSLKRFSAGTTPRPKRKKIPGWSSSRSNMAGAQKKFNQPGGTAGKTLAGGLALHALANETSIPPHQDLAIQERSAKPPAGGSARPPFPESPGSSLFAFPRGALRHRSIISDFHSSP
jgi:hypothetical protein